MDEGFPGVAPAGDPAPARGADSTSARADARLTGTDTGPGSGSAGSEASLPAPDRPARLFAFFERLKTMSSIRRFGTLPMIEEETVAAHSYNVAIFALMIADYEGLPEVKVEALLRKALFHDFEETILSDIPHPIKHRFKGGMLGKLLKEIVPELVEQEVFKELPERLRRIYVASALRSKDDLEGRLVEAGDAMDIVMTSLRELKLGNRYFESIFDIGLQMLERHKHFKFAALFMEAAVDYRRLGDKATSQTTFSDEFIP